MSFPSIGSFVPNISSAVSRAISSRPSVGSGTGVGGPSSGDGFQGSRDAQLEGDLEKRLQAVSQAQGQDREKAVSDLKQAYDQAGGKGANISEDLKNKIEQALGGGQTGGGAQPGGGQSGGGCGGAQGGGGGGQQGGGCKGGQCGGGQPSQQEPYKASLGVKDALKAMGIDMSDKELEKLKADKEKEKALKTLGLTQDQVDKAKGADKSEAGSTTAKPVESSPKAEATYPEATPKVEAVTPTAPAPKVEAPAPPIPTPAPVSPVGSGNLGSGPVTEGGAPLPAVSASM